MGHALMGDGTNEGEALLLRWGDDLKIRNARNLPRLEAVKRYWPLSDLWGVTSLVLKDEAPVARTNERAAWKALLSTRHAQDVGPIVSANGRALRIGAGK